VEIIGDIDAGRSLCQKQWIECMFNITILEFSIQDIHSFVEKGKCYE